MLTKPNLTLKQTTSLRKSASETEKYIKAFKEKAEISKVKQHFQT